MARLGISLHPEHSTLEKDRTYATLTAKYGFERIFTCLLSMDKEREETLAESRELIDHVHSYGMEVILGIAPPVFKELHVSYDDLPFFAEIHTDSIRLDGGFDSLKGTSMIYSPQNLKIEVNAGLGTEYLDNITSRYPKLENVITCYNLYPQRYSGISYERFERCSQDIKNLNIKVAAFVSSQEGGAYGPWPVNEGLCTLETHRDLPIGVQVRHLFAIRLVDDVIIVNAHASEEKLSMPSKIDPGKLTFKVGLEADFHPAERKTLYEHPYFVRGDMSEYMARSTMSCIAYAKEGIPPKNTRDLERGGAVVVNNEYPRYKRELHIVLRDMPDDGRRNIIGHIPEDENILLDYIKPWKSFGFIHQYQERGETMVTPIYRKIEDLIMWEIEDKAANSPIGSERDMAVRPDVSRTTVRKAVDELVDGGFLYRDKNRGTFVADCRLLKKNIAAEVLQEEISEFIVMYSGIKGIADIAPVLGIGQDDQVLSVVRLNTVNSKPTSIEEIFSIRNQISDADMKNLKNLPGMNDYVESGRITRKFMPILVPVQFANLLKVKVNTPTIRVESVISSMSEKSLVYVRTYNNPFGNVIEITL